MSNPNFTREFIGRLESQLVALLGPIVTDIVIRIVAREAKLDLSPEQLNELQVNRAKAISARADEARRAGGSDGAAKK